MDAIGQKPNLQMLKHQVADKTLLPEVKSNTPLCRAQKQIEKTISRTPCSSINDRTCTESVASNASYENNIYTDIVQKLIQLYIPQKIICDSEIENMSDALRYVGVDSLDKALSLDLKPIPRGALFHTWVAIKGTTLFHKGNNDKGLDYVSRVRHESRQLNEWGVPLFFVYSEKKLSPEQIEEMEKNFKDEANVVVLSLEKDLNTIDPKLYQVSEFQVDDLVFMDYLRIFIIESFPEVLEISRAKAIQKGKLDYLKNLEATGTDSVCYSDIDNAFIKAPPCILARHGKCSEAVLSGFVPLSIGCKYIEKLGETDLKRLGEHRSHFSSKPYLKCDDIYGARVKTEDESYEYLTKGLAEKEYNQLGEIISHVADYTHRPSCFNWEGENSFFLVSKESRFDAAKQADLSIIVDFHQPIDAHINPDKHHLTAHALVGIQLWKYLSRGNDNSWSTAHDIFHEAVLHRDSNKSDNILTNSSDHVSR